MVRAQLLLLLAPAAATQEGFVPKCASLLGGVAASGQSDVEVAAFCRQAYTPSMCSTMRSSLGPMPWPAAKIQTSCQRWGSDLAAKSDRDLMTYEEFNNALEASAELKKQYGFNMPRNADGSVDLDKTVKMKFEQTQTMQRAYNSYMGWEESTPPPQQHNFFGQWTAGRVAFGADGLANTVAAFGLVAFFMLIAGAAVGMVRWMRRSRPAQLQKDTLLEDGSVE